MTVRRRFTDAVPMSTRRRKTTAPGASAFAVSRRVAGGEAENSDRSLTSSRSLSVAVRATLVPYLLRPNSPMLHERHRNAMHAARADRIDRRSPGKFHAADRRHPLCPLAYWFPAHRRGADRAVQLAVLPPHRRQDAAAHRGHGPRALDGGRDRRDPRRPGLARPSLGRRAPSRNSACAAAIARWRRNWFGRGKAYYCFATPEELNEMREKARAEGRPPRYDGRWRDRDPSEAPAGVKARYPN